MLGSLIAAQILGTLVLGLSVAHNGWVWFQGGDQIWMTTTGWLFGRLELPPTEIAYLWPFAQAPVTWVTGSTYVQALPVLVVLQVLVLGPIALLCVYGIAARIAGRPLGYWAAFLWVVAPFAVIPLWVERYHERWTEQFLPQALGLTAMADFPSMVLSLAAALFVLRSLESTRRLEDAILAGALLGAAGALKPPNLLLAGGVVLAYAVARRWREGLACLAATAPALLVLLAWKVKGLGEIPAFALGHQRVAAGAGPLAIDLRVDRYVELDLDHWRVQMAQLREFFYAPRVAQWAPVAGLIAVVRVRRGAIAALLGGWLTAYILVKGFSPRADIQANTFWRLLMPAWPAYLLLLASIPLLVPTFARRLGDRARSPSTRSVGRRWIAVTVALTVVVPAVALVASSPMQRPTPAIMQDFPGGNILTPVDDGVALRVASEGGARRLTWKPGASWRADVFYRVYRQDGAGPDLHCALSGSTAWYCYLTGTPIATTRSTSFVDPSPPPEATYRIGVGTNWIDDPAAGDVFVFSPPVAAHG
ncbi:MAG TPA: hypothetical protein VFT27_06015 [Actinomycetota bacterium]|nr:hypothetical protein [Actinomycetota bacterium]